MPGAAPVQPGQVVDGDFFPITGCR
jgi:hypothetical protein